VGLEPVGWAVTGEEQALIHSRIRGRRRLCRPWKFEGLLEWRYARWDLEEKYKIFKTDLEGKLEE
jgi:hypothetical protein